MNVKLKSVLMASVASVALSGVAVAADEPKGSIEEIIVVGDPLKLVELADTDTVYGISQSYLEAPRSVSVLSDATLDRYGIDDVNDLITTTPGTFTGSFFGVPGTPTIRGGRADSYYRGFKRVENPGTFPTPLGAAERLEIVRGPAPVNFGAGRIGGLVNYVPYTNKTARDASHEGITGSLTMTYGSYQKQMLDADFGVPWEIKGNEGGFYLFAEFEDSESFHDGIEPEHNLVQASLQQDFGSRTHFEVGFMQYSSSGYLQTIGWNRLTQDLIDSGEYITGQDTTLVDTNGDGRLQPGEVDAAIGAGNLQQFLDFGVTLNDAFSLDTGLGVTELDRQTVFVSDRDIADADTTTAYLDLSHEFDFGTFRLQGFMDSLDAQLYQSYGYAGDYQADVFEIRFNYTVSNEIGNEFAFDINVGTSYRSYDNETRQTYLSGYLALDRRDLSVGPTATDIFDDPFSQEAGTIGWDTDIDSKWTDTAFFLVGNFIAMEQIDLLVALRYDYWDVESINTGDTIFDAAYDSVLFEDTDNTLSYEIALTWRNDMGAWPYFMYAESNALETNDAGGIEVERIAQGNYLADSRLFEGGMRFNAWDGRITGGWSLYDQERVRVDPFGNIDSEDSNGFEGEVRVLFTDELSATGAVTFQQTRIGAPGACGDGNGEYVVVTPDRAGGYTGEEGYGGLFAALNASCITELENGYERTMLPESILSAFLTYTSTQTKYGSFGVTAGGTYVSSMEGKVLERIQLPSYFVARFGATWQHEYFKVDLNVNNLFDERYFSPVQNVFEDVAVLPSAGREFRLSITGRF